MREGEWRLVAVVGCCGLRMKILHCVCVCVRERERVTHACMHTYRHTHYVHTNLEEEVWLKY